MTTIVAKRDPMTGEVWIGADRQRSDTADDVRMLDTGDKLWSALGCLWAGTGALTSLQRLRSWLRYPDPARRPPTTDDDLQALMDRARADLFATSGEAPWLLVATPAAIYDCHCLGSALLCGPAGGANGSGRAPALAVLFDRRDEPARETVLRALRAACALDVWSGGGIDLWRVGDPAPERVDQ